MAQAAEIKQLPFVFDGQPWVAVLVDRATGSSGEVVALSFAGRIHERSFGEHTAGFTTANTPHPMPDGAVLVLCEGLEADRTGELYRDGVDLTLTYRPHKDGQLKREIRLCRLRRNG